MLFGQNITRQDLEFKASQVVVAVREAFVQVNIVSGWLADHPSNAPDGDILTKAETDGGFGYTADEAYLIRVVFEGLSGLTVAPLLEQGRKLTGLQ